VAAARKTLDKVHARQRAATLVWEKKKMKVWNSSSPLTWKVLVAGCSRSNLLAP
jgi:hypothetical protein